MSLKVLLTGELTLGLRIRNALVQRCYATGTVPVKDEPAKNETIDLTTVDTRPQFVDEIDTTAEEIEAMRNKSRLIQSHRNVLHNRRPYEGETPDSIHFKTIRWRQRMLGRYGIEGSNVEPGLAWPTKAKIAIMNEFERVAYPYSLQEGWAKIEAEKQAQAEKIRLREESLAKNLAKTGQWEKELNERRAKKEAAVLAARERKERLIEEVRRHFGFKVNPKDEKFKEMLEQKEKEDMKRKKAAKKQQRAEQLVAKLLKDAPKEGSEGAEAKDMSKPPTPADLV